MLLFAAALLAAFIIYAPALNGEFVFDDRTLPFLYENAKFLTLRDWVGVRPLLMITYYLNYKTSGLDSFPYHALNVLLHAGCSVLIFFAVRRILEWSGVPERRRLGAALFAAALFLVHPLQTEAVSYIASRSETLSVLFFLAAYNVFLYRRSAEISFGTAAGVLALYAVAMSCKEHTAILPLVILLTDYFFNPGFSFSGIRRNWRLYVPVAFLGALGLLYFSRQITAGSNIGFALKDLTPYEYFSTQLRAIFTYFRLFLLPYGQNVDYNFPISHNLLQRGSFIYGIGLLALIVVAFRFRKRYTIACFGFLLALVLFAPTSSLLPIRDPLVERRLYLPFIGLALIACDAALRIRWTRNTAVATLTGICVLLAVLSFQRNRAWVNMDSLWRDSAGKNPDNPRALMGLADALALGGHCAEAIPYFKRAAELQPDDYRSVYNLANAFDCSNQLPAAREAFKAAIKINPTADGWDHLAMIQMKSREYDAAFDSLAQAQKLNPNALLTYNYRGILLLALARFNEAGAQFQNVLANVPNDEIALRGMARAEKHERQF